MALQLTLMPLDVDPNSKPITKIFYKDELTLGRLPSNDLVLNKPEVSGIHARLRVEKDEYGEISKLYITDLGSSNGTMIEKTPLRPRVEVSMMTNERIFIGNFVIKPTPIFDEDYEESNQTLTNLERPSGLEDALKDYDSSQSSSKRDIVIDEDETEDDLSYNSKSKPDAFSSLLFSEPKAEPKSSLAKNFSERFHSDGSIEREEVRPRRREGKTEDMRDLNVQVHQAKSLNDKNISEKNVSENVLNENVLNEKFSNEKSPPKRLKETFSIKVSVDGQDITTANIVAKAFTSVYGKIDNKGKSLQGVQVTSKTLGTVETDSEGFFTFKKVLEGTDYELQFSKEKYSFEPKWIKGVSSTKPISIDIEATKLCTISGVVSHNGQPLSGVEVDGGELGRVITDSDGVYTFENVPEGHEYNLTLSKEGFAFHD